MNKLEYKRIMDSTTMHFMQYFECEKIHPNCMRFCIPCILYYGQVNQEKLPHSYQVSKEIADMRPKYPFDDISESAVVSLQKSVILNLSLFGKVQIIFQDQSRYNEEKFKELISNPKDFLNMFKEYDFHKSKATK